jgi:hypothetical protein
LVKLDLIVLSAFDEGEKMVELLFDCAYGDLEVFFNSIEVGLVLSNEGL